MSERITNPQKALNYLTHRYQEEANIKNEIERHLLDGFKPKSIKPDESEKLAVLNMESKKQGSNDIYQAHFYIHWNSLGIALNILQDYGHETPGLYFNK